MDQEESLACERNEDYLRSTTCCQLTPRSRDRVVLSRCPALPAQLILVRRYGIPIYTKYPDLSMDRNHGDGILAYYKPTSNSGGRFNNIQPALTHGALMERCNRCESIIYILAVGSSFNALFSLDSCAKVSKL